MQYSNNRNTERWPITLSWLSNLAVELNSSRPADDPKWLFVSGTSNTWKLLAPVTLLRQNALRFVAKFLNWKWSHGNQLMSGRILKLRSQGRPRDLLRNDKVSYLLSHQNKKPSRLRLYCPRKKQKFLKEIICVVASENGASPPLWKTTLKRWKKSSLMNSWRFFWNTMKVPERNHRRH